MERTKLIRAVQQSALNVPHDNVTTSRTLECPKTTVFVYATPSLQRLQAEGDWRDEGGRRMSLMGHYRSLVRQTDRNMLIVGKLDVLNVQCDKCGRRGRYHPHRLIERYGIDAKFRGL
jgi:hypothetical protein